MNTLIRFFSGDYVKVLTGIIAILSFCISLYNLINLILKNRINFEINVTQLSKPINDTQLIYIDIINKSEKNLIISNLCISYKGNEYHATRSPKMFQESTRTRGKEVLERKQYYTSGLPFTISGLYTFSECFEFKLKNNYSIPDSKEVRVTVITNKGKKTKRIEFPTYAEVFSV